MRKLILVTGMACTLLTATAVAVCVYVRRHSMLHMSIPHCVQLVSVCVLLLHTVNHVVFCNMVRLGLILNCITAFLGWSHPAAW